MRRPLFTGSGAERALACPPSQAMPGVVEQPGEPAKLGTSIHAFLATAPTAGREAALAVSTHPEACAAIDIDQLPQLDARGYAAEVAFAFDVETGRARELGRNIGRAYPELGEHEVPLTVDTVGLTADGEGVFVGDFKSGHKRLTRARSNAQVLLGALAAARAYGRTRGEVAVIYVRPDEQPFFDRAALDEWDLDAFAVRVRAAGAAVRHARAAWAAGQELEVFEGDHCEHCPAFRRCPAKVALVHAVTSSPATWRQDARDMLTPAAAADAVRRVKLARQALHLVQVELEAYASEVGGIDMGDGVTYGPRRTVRESVDGPIVHRVLTEMHGRDIADRAVTFEATKSGIEDALRKVVQDTPGAKLAPLNRAVLDAVRAAGGVADKVNVKVDEHRVRRQA